MNSKSTMSSISNPNHSSGWSDYFIAHHVSCEYVNVSNVPPLTEVPTNIPAAETVVTLTNNAIASLDGQLDHMTNLQQLNIKINKLATMPKLSASAGSTLTVLLLTRNEISEVCLVDLMPLSSLVTLQLHHNKLKVFPDLSPLGDTLDFLGMESNGMTTVPAERLKPLVKLTTLKLSSNSLTALPDVSALSGSLTTFQVNNNLLERVGANEMQALNGITAVGLKNSLISSLPNVCFDTPTKLDLRGSALDLCECSNAWLKQAEEDCSLTLVITDGMCSGTATAWSAMTYAQLNTVCHVVEEQPSDCKLGKIFEMLI